MSDTTTTEKANYGAKAGQVIAGNLIRSASGQFGSAGSATGVPPKAAAFATRRAAAIARAKPKGGKGAKPKPKAAKPKSGAATQRKAELLAKAVQRKAELEKRKAERAQAKADRELKRGVEKLASDAKKTAAAAKRIEAQAKRKAEVEKRRAAIEAKRAAKPAAGGGGGKGGGSKKPDVNANRATVQAATLDKAAFDVLEQLVSGATPEAGPGLDALLASGLAERDTTGGVRISQAGRAYTNAADAGDVGRAKDAISRAADRVAKVRVTTKAQTAQDRAIHASMGSSSGGGGGGSGSRAWKVNPATGKREPNERQLAAAVSREARRTGGVSAKTEARITTVVHNSIRSGKVTKRDLEINISHQEQIRAARGSDIQSHRRDLERAQTNEIRQMDRRSLRRAEGEAAAADAFIRSLKDGKKNFNKLAPDTTTKEASPASITVFKQANGRYRWLGISSTALEDRDQQVVSLKALGDDCDRADSDGAYGTLRFWHVPGLDLGTCDYNAVFGVSLVESGEFYDASVGEAFATSKEHWQMSLGFLHDRSQPDSDGVYHSIRRFERSILPASAASNPFTSLLIYKGNTTMSNAVKLAKLKEVLGGSVDDAILTAMLDQADQKAALAAGVRHKETDMPEVELKADGAPGPDALAEDASMDEDAAEDDGALLTENEINAIADRAAERVLAKLMPMLGQTATKENAAVTEVAATAADLTERVKALQATTASATATATAANAELVTLKARIAELETDQPRAYAGGYRATQDGATVTEKSTHAKPAMDELASAAGWLIGA